jgi:hypothetical protein
MIGSIFNLMSLKERIEKKRAVVVDRWFDLVTESYQADTQSFLKSNKDPFSNPVRSNTLKALQGTLEQLLGDMDRDALVAQLDPAIRIRAVQNFSPAQAVGFVFALKRVIREMAGVGSKGGVGGSQAVAELLELESRIDQVALVAMDIFLACREKIYSLKANVERDTIYSAFRRAGLVKEEPEDRPPLRVL